jgi:glutamate racemase
VLRSLRAALPQCDFLYLADTARVPYGRKPKEMVRDFAFGITEFLLELGVSGIIVACNTASAAALPDLAETYPVPVWGVIDPGVEAARRATRSGHVGVIGTKGAIAMGVYQSRLEALGLSVWARACPMFVHLVEEGLSESDEARLMARHYLQDRPDIDTLILGCTHYPVLRNVIQEAVGTSVQLVESAGTTAEAVSKHLPRMQADNGSGKVLHLVTGDVLAYRHTANVIGGVDGDVQGLDVSSLNSARSH